LLNKELKKPILKERKHTAMSIFPLDDKGNSGENKRK
jgi:hypothetical protein